MDTTLRENTDNNRENTKPTKMENLLVKMDEMMEDMIDCLYEYEEKIEKTGVKFKTSAAEEFEDAKKKIVELHDSVDSKQNDVVALLKNQLKIAREGQAKVEEENERLKKAIDESKDPSAVQKLQKDNRVLRKDNEELHKLLEEAEKALAETEEMEAQLGALKKENKRVRKALKKSFERNNTRTNKAEQKPTSPIPPPSPLTPPSTRSSHDDQRVQDLTLSLQESQKDLKHSRDENIKLQERVQQLGKWICRHTQTYTHTHTHTHSYKSTNIQRRVRKYHEETCGGIRKGVETIKE